MKCKEIQELILTDYLDGEMSREEEMSFEAHIVDCRGCRELEAAVRKAAQEPFHHSAKARPHDEVWYKIRECLEEEQKEKRLYSGFVNGAHSFLPSVKPIFAAAAVMVLFLGAILLMKLPEEKETMATQKLEKHMDSLAYLAEGSSLFTTDEGEGFGTSIEEYFL